jgi:Ca2+-binding EF-hand superfamily protein
VAQVSHEAGTVVFRVTGTNPCGAVHFMYGDGKAVTHPISELPATITYTYAASGDYTVVVQGMGNCGGEVRTQIRTRVPVAATPPAPSREDDRARARGRAAAPEEESSRFAGMDTSGDGVITRREWTRGAGLFRAFDLNGDGMLSGIELQSAAARRRTFEELDRNQNGQLRTDEWRYDAATFRRLDRNADGLVTMTEFADTELDDLREDRFDTLDRNNDGYLARGEWRGAAEAFGWLDIDNDGRLSRDEVVGDGEDAADRNASGTPGRVRVDLRLPGNVAWRDTGLTVRAGEEVVIRATGEIRWTPRPEDRATAAGSRSGARIGGAPLPGIAVGALIARVGDSAPFLATSSDGRLRMPQSGRLFLGVNDDDVADNGGEFAVTIQLLR